MQQARTVEVMLVCLVIVLMAACESAERRNFREGLEAREASLIERRDLAANFVADLAAELEEEHGASEEAGCPELEELPGINAEGGFSAWSAEARARVQREREAQAQARREAFERNLPAERCLCLQGTLAVVRTWIDADIEEEIATQRERLDGWSQTELETAIMLSGVPQPVSMDSVREAIEDWRRRRHEDWTGGDPNARWGDDGTPFGWNDFRYRPSAQATAPPSTRPLLTGLRWQYRDHSCSSVR